jgi:aminoglycoside phosphotransferase (APT) family kinase protein
MGFTQGMEQTATERARLLRVIKKSLLEVLVGELSSDRARDAASHVDRCLTHLIIEEEGEALGEELARELAKCFARDHEPDRETSLRALRERLAARTDGVRWSSLEQPIDSSASRIGCGCRAELNFQERVAALRDELCFDSSSVGESAADDATTASLAERLERWLRGRLPDAPRVAVQRITPIPGGRVKLTALVELSEQGDLPEQVVLRKDVPGALLDTKAAQEAPILQLVRRAGIPAPEPLLVEADPDPLDGSFMIVERIRGEKQGEVFADVDCTVRQPRAIGADIARILARLHAIPLDQIERAGLHVPTDIRTEIRARVEGLVDATGTLRGPRCPEIDVARSWLSSRVEDVSGTPTLVHNDFGLHNLLIDDDHVSGVLDWELAGVGLPAMDLASCYALMQVLLPWPEFVDIYHEHGGSRDATSVEALGFFRVLLHARQTRTSRMCRHMFLSGQSDDIVIANAGIDFLFRCRRLLTHALVDALENPGDAMRRHRNGDVSRPALEE